MTSNSVSSGWTNWAGTVSWKPARTVQVRDTEDMVATITSAAERGQAVRALGSHHSFSSIAATRGVGIDLAQWTGITHVDHNAGLVTVRSGTVLRELNVALARLGLALANLGDIDAQTVAGAISTGTHGTGAKLGGLATQVRELELILADGSTRTCSAYTNPELFAAARIGLGALGLISTITLQCVPAFALAADEAPEPLESVLERFDELVESNDHAEFYWFPYGHNALVKRNNRLPQDAIPEPLHPVRKYFEYQIMENTAFGALCRAGRIAPGSVRFLHRIISSSMSRRNYSDASYRVFSTPRNVRFVETEYAIDRSNLIDVLTELRAQLSIVEHPVMFPVEVRVAAADDIWLSTAYQRKTAYIAVHQFQGMPYRHWFQIFESVAREAGGRPHWGKMHTMDAASLRARYPRFDDFLRIRDKVDPDLRFTNPHLDHILGRGAFN